MDFSMTTADQTLNNLEKQNQGMSRPQQLTASVFVDLRLLIPVQIHHLKGGMCNFGFYCMCPGTCCASPSAVLGLFTQGRYRHRSVK